MNSGHTGNSDYMGHSELRGARSQITSEGRGAISEQKNKNPKAKAWNPDS